MKILITGSKGFVGRNLCAQLRNIRDGKARNYDVAVDEVYEYDMDSTPEELDEWCSRADFVFNLAGVNRPQNPEEFMSGNFGFASTLLDTLKKHGNTCPVMLSSSIQASLSGRFGDSASGAGRTTTPPWRHSATTSQTTFLSGSTTRLWNWNCSTSTTWWTR